MVSSRLALLLAVFLSTAGCGSGEGRASGEPPSGPTLIVVDSVLLAESDSVYIGKPGKPAVDPRDGSFYVPDFFSNVVYRFSRTGELLNIYGRPGGGPGEFESVAAAFIPDDSTLGVVDGGNNKLSFFHRESGVHQRDVALTADPAQAHPLLTDGGALIHTWAVGAEKSLIDLQFSDETMQLRGRPPGAFLRSLRNGGRFAHLAAASGFLADRGDHILHGYRVQDWVFERARDGSITDSVFVPAVRRKGVPADLRHKMDVERISQLDAMELTSALFGIHTLPDGKVALVHHDVTLLDRSIIPPPTAATVWVSLLSEDLERACVDAVLSESADAKPMETFRGDTLFQLDRRIVEGGSEVDGGRPGPGLETWLRIVRIDAEGCDWIPAQPPEE